MPIIISSRTKTGVQVSRNSCSLTWVSSINCASARCSRATAPVSTTNRAPDNLAAVSKSIPGLTPAMSKCSTGWNANARGWPQRRISTLPVSSGPSGTEASGRLGKSINRSRSATSSAFAASSNAATSAFLLAITVRRRSNSTSSPRALAAPTSLDARFCSAWPVSAARILLRRASSNAKISAERGPSPRRARPASKASGFSRMARISCIWQILG